MATPRIFVSSTCYDLQEIRHNLRNFILDFAYEPVMSDYGDVFYEYDQHVQDSCMREIEKSQMYLLIVGNNYGSMYHKEPRDKEYPESVTLAEFRKSVSLNIPKLIFINRYVSYDHRNYLKALNDHLKNYFKSEQVKEQEIESTRQKLQNAFDQKYPFPQLSYRYIFRFLDVINSLPKNNAVLDFETFDEIKLQLKKQWAGFLFDKLSDYKADVQRKDSELRLDEIKTKVASIDKLLRDSFEKSTASDGRLTISLKTIEDSLAFSELKDAQEMLETTMFGILYMYDFDGDQRQRATITSKLSVDGVVGWLNSLEKKVDTYKWSKFIPVGELLDGFEIKYWEDREKVDFEAVVKLNALFKNIPKSEIDNFAKAVLLKLENVYDKKATETAEEIPF